MFPDGIQERRRGLDVTADQEAGRQIDDRLLGRVPRIDALRHVVRQSGPQCTNADRPVLGVHPEQLVQARRGGSRGPETDQGQGCTQRGRGKQRVFRAIALHEQTPADLLRGVAATLARGLSEFCATYVAVPVRNSTLDSTEQPLTAATARPARIRVRRFSNMGFLRGCVISLQSHPGVGHDLSFMVTVTELPETGWRSFQVRSPCFHSFPPTLTFSMPRSVALAMAR